MFSQHKDQGTEVKNMSIIEDLGMLHYIFTDKTGTLTCNQMEFRSMCVGEKIFGPMLLGLGQEIELTDSDINRLHDHEPGELSPRTIFNKHRFNDYISGKNSTQKVDLTIRSANGNETMQITSQS